MQLELFVWKDETLSFLGNALRAHIRIGGHFMGRQV